MIALGVTVVDVIDTDVIAAVFIYVTAVDVFGFYAQPRPPGTL